MEIRNNNGVVETVETQGQEIFVVSSKGLRRLHLKLESKVENAHQLRELLKTHYPDLDKMVMVEGNSQVQLIFKENEELCSRLSSSEKLIIFLRPEKTSNGSVKNLENLSFSELRKILQDEGKECKDYIKEVSNKNWTQCSTADLKKFLSNYFSLRNNVENLSVVQEETIESIEVVQEEIVNAEKLSKLASDNLQRDIAPTKVAQAVIVDEVTQAAVEKPTVSEEPIDEFEQIFDLLSTLTYPITKEEVLLSQENVYNLFSEEEVEQIKKAIKLEVTLVEISRQLLSVKESYYTTVNNFNKIVDSDFNERKEMFLKREEEKVESIFKILEEKMKKYDFVK